MLRVPLLRAGFCNRTVTVDSEQLKVKIEKRSTINDRRLSIYLLPFTVHYPRSTIYDPPWLGLDLEIKPEGELDLAIGAKAYGAFDGLAELAEGGAAGRLGERGSGLQHVAGGR